MIIAQYEINGALDSSFGHEGKGIAKFDSGKSVVNDICISENGKIILGGFNYLGSGSSNFALSCFDPSGNLDSSFGILGKITTDFGYFESVYRVMNLQGDILAAGISQGIGTPDYINNFALARYNGDPTPPLITKIKTWIRRHILNFQDNNPNADYYIIEQSKNSKEFSEIARVDAQITNSKKQETNNESQILKSATYSISLPQTRNKKQETVFYRIKAVDKDGNFNYSDIVADKELTNQQSNQSTINIFPNPVKDKINIQSAKEVNLRLQNSFGQVLLTQKIMGSGSMDISKLKAGVYYLVDAESGDSFKVVKE